MEFKNIIEKLLADPIKIRLFSVLSQNRGGLSGRALGVLCSTSSFKIQQVVRELVAQGVLTESIAGRSHLYRLNLSHILVQEVIHPLLQFEGNLLKQLGAKILKSLNPKPLAVIIYGSVARGEETAQSDIDLLLIDPEKGKLPNPAPFAERIVRAYGNFASFKRMTVNELREKVRQKDPLIRNVVKEGRSLAGLPLMEVLDYGRQKDKHHHSSQE
ncbi:MAG: nucleotidyltransferase domain-containing protein [Deltaproteobacteria bacterium]|nr:nucleotidyltransferase domain-containing protein [Deltaproteobacteria bacterium]